MHQREASVVRKLATTSWSQSLCLQLFEVINQDYNDFVDLSTKLVNVEAAVLQFQAPLEEVQVGSKPIPCVCVASAGRRHTQLGPRCRTVWEMWLHLWRQS